MEQVAKMGIAIDHLFDHTVFVSNGQILEEEITKLA